MPQLLNVAAGGCRRPGRGPTCGLRGSLAGPDRKILELRPGITARHAAVRDEERWLALARNPQAFNDAASTRKCA
jgi:hypothetical protein